MDKKKWILVGVGLLALGLIAGLVPASASYSDYGLWSNEGAVDVECGSLLDRDVRADFADWEEQQEYDQEVSWYGEPAIFEGQTATQVCDDELGNSRAAVILLAIGGLGALAIGITRKPPVWNDGTSRPGAAAEPGAPAQGVSAEPASAGPGTTARAHEPDPPAPDAPAPDAVAPDDSGGEPLDVTRPRADVPAVAPRRPKSYTVVFDNGEVADLASPLVIGRDPAPFDAAPGARLHALADHTHTISKTHLALVPDGEGVWVVDHNSTNGTVVVDGAGELFAEPGVRTRAVPGQTIRFGDRTLTIDEGK